MKADSQILQTINSLKGSILSGHWNRKIMCIKYEASSEKDMHKSGWMRPSRPNVPGDESKPRKEELERQMSVLLPTKSPDKED